MQYSDLKLLAKVCYVVGSLSFLFAIVAYVYEERPWWGGGYWLEHPYRDYAVPLVFLGIVLLALGYLLDTAKEEKTEQTAPAPSRHACMMSIEVKFCPNCGKELKTD